MTNLATLLVEAAVRFPRRSAFRLRETVLTYAELDELSAHVAGGLSAHGVRVGDRVGTMVPYASAFPLLYFGALCGSGRSSCPCTRLPRRPRPGPGERRGGPGWSSRPTTRPRPPTWR
ncbi:AMP-binding protein [Streptomyces sp. SID5477]|nr:AMP-binding protein [Streptomyces sp. SID5477]